MVMDKFSLMMEAIIKENSKIINYMVKASIFGKININTKDHGKRIQNMGME